MKVPLRIALFKEYYNLGRGYISDFKRYAKYACIGLNRLDMDEPQIEGRVIATYHVIEKGLSMPEFRPGFGIPMVKNLIKMLGDLENTCNVQRNINIQTARQVVTAYVQKHLEVDFDLSNDFSKEELHYWSKENTLISLQAGANAYLRENYFKDAKAPFNAFAKSRHSCRIFDAARPVQLDLIYKAVETARFAPSVCNRQCWRLHFFQESALVQELLSFQGGNRGFGHTIPTIGVVTANVKVFSGYAERSQGYFDGGLFAMALMYALHHLELGTVPLCWLVPLTTDRAFRVAADIPDDEVILMLIGIGVPEQQFSSPASQRREVSEILKIH